MSHEDEMVTTGEGTCQAHREADGDGEEAKQDQVDWVLLMVEVQRAQHCTPKENEQSCSGLHHQSTCSALHHQSTSN